MPVRPLALLALLLACAGPVFADSLDGDPRLAAPRTLRSHDQTVQDLLADYNLKTGVRFFADPAMADLRATVFSHDRPLAETLRALAALLHGEWRRDGKAPDFAYTLAEARDYAAEREKSREADLRSALDAIRQEVADFERLEKLPARQLYEVSARLARDLATSPVPAKSRSLAIEHAVCEQILNHNEWRRMLNRLLRVLPDEALAKAFRPGGLEVAWPPAVGAEEMPAAAVAEIRSLPDPTGVSIVAGVNGTSAIRVRFTGEQRRGCALRWQMILARPYMSSFRCVRGEGRTPLAPPEPPADALEAAGADWKADPALSARVSVRSTSPEPPADVTWGAMPRARTSLGQVLDLIDRERPINVVADAFYSSRLSGFVQQDRPVGEAVERLCQTTKRRWWRQDGFVFIRTRDFEGDRRAELPAGAVRRWTQRAQNGPLELDDYGEIAALPEAQLATLKDMSLHNEFPATLDPVSQAAEHLRLWNAFTRAQRRRSESQGVAYAELSAQAQRLFRQAAEEMLLSVGKRDEPAQWARLQFRLETHHSQLWGARDHGSVFLSGVNSRDEALSQIQRQDPAVKLEDLRTVIFTALAFHYDGPDGAIGTAYASLPSRWEEPGRVRE